MLFCGELLALRLYGARCTEFLFGSRAIPVYHAVYAVFVAIGASVKLAIVWQIAESMNALMAIPNLVAVLALTPVVVKLTREYFGEKMVKLSEDSEDEIA